MGVGTRVRVVSGLDMISGVTGTVVAVLPSEPETYRVYMDKSWADLGSINPSFQGHLMLAEGSALEELR